MDPGPLRDALTVVLGVITGILSGLFGVGGAVISTPGIRALGALPLIAVGSTLPSIIPGAATGTARYLRERLIDARVVALTAPFGAAAAIAGAALADVIPGDGHALMFATAALLAYSAWRMWAKAQRDAAGIEPPARAVDPPRLALAVIGIAAGFVSGLLGIGGGVLMVPAFTQRVGLPIKAAIATSLACVAIFAMPGTITHAIEGNIDWRLALLLAAGVIPGSWLGAHLTVIAKEATVQRVVALFLGATAVLFAVGEVIAL